MTKLVTIRGDSVTELEISYSHMYALTRTDLQLTSYQLLVTIYLLPTSPSCKSLSSKAIERIMPSKMNPEVSGCGWKDSRPVEISISHITNRGVEFFGLAPLNPFKINNKFRMSRKTT